MVVEITLVSHFPALLDGWDAAIETAVVKVAADERCVFVSLVCADFFSYPSFIPNPMRARDGVGWRDALEPTI